MSLNIKNEQTHALVRELAERTGRSQTSAVEDAVRRRLAELDRDGDDTMLEDLRRISEESAARMTPEEKGFDYDAWLYDAQTGLPR